MLLQIIASKKQIEAKYAQSKEAVVRPLPQILTARAVAHSARDHCNGIFIPSLPISM
jgi:hypothetical protein